MKKRFFSFVLSLLLCVFNFFNTPFSVCADEKVYYSNVLANLTSDPDFSIEDYPNISDESIIEVITIAENDRHELLIYTYEPLVYEDENTVELRANSITMNTEENFNLYSLRHYYLTHLDSDGVFHKYRVDGYIVENRNVVPSRVYEISSIYARTNELMENGNIREEKAYSVSRRFTITGNDTSCLSILKEKVSTIQITDSFVGFLRYTDGWIFYNQMKVDNHFIAFNYNASDDFEISELQEASVMYKANKNEVRFDGLFVHYSDTPLLQEDNSDIWYAELNYKDKTYHESQGWFCEDKEFEQIQTVEDFISSVEADSCIFNFGEILNINSSHSFTNEEETELRKCEFVLRFATTDYSFIYTDLESGSYTEKYTGIRDVSILRLKGLDGNGETFNLGVVCDILTGSPEPVGSEHLNIELNETLKFVVELIALVLLAVVLLWLRPIIKIIFKIILFPFKTIVNLFKRGRRR